jgi:hypothetical protein
MGGFDELAAAREAVERGAGEPLSFTSLRPILAPQVGGDDAAVARRHGPPPVEKLFDSNVEIAQVFSSFFAKALAGRRNRGLCYASRADFSEFSDFARFGEGALGLSRTA